MSRIDYNRCDCEVCKRHRKFEECIDRVPKKDRKFWEGVMLKLNEVEEELSYEQSITIPQLKERLKNDDPNHRR